MIFSTSRHFVRETNNSIEDSAKEVIVLVWSGHFVFGFSKQMSNRIFSRIQRISWHQCGLLWTMLPVDFKHSEKIVSWSPFAIKSFCWKQLDYCKLLSRANIEYGQRCHRHSFLTFYTSNHTSQARISILLPVCRIWEYFQRVGNILNFWKNHHFLGVPNPKLLRLNTMSTHPAHKPQRQWVLWFNNSCIYVLDLFSDVCLNLTEMLISHSSS